jgi:hypothetical protein
MHQCFALGVVDPALGAAAHVHQEHGGQRALVALAAAEQARAGLGTAAPIGDGFDQRIHVDLLAVGLAAQHVRSSPRMASKRRRNWRISGAWRTRTAGT